MAQVADTTSFYVGLKLRWQDGIWEIVEYDHHKMGRGGAVVRTKLRNVETGSIVENSFKPAKNSNALFTRTNLPSIHTGTARIMSSWILRLTKR